MSPSYIIIFRVFCYCIVLANAVISDSCNSIQFINFRLINTEKIGGFAVVFLTKANGSGNNARYALKRMYVNNQVDLNAAKREIQIAVSTRLFAYACDIVNAGSILVWFYLINYSFPVAARNFIVLSVRPKSTSSHRILDIISHFRVIYRDTRILLDM